MRSIAIPLPSRKMKELTHCNPTRRKLEFDNVHKDHPDEFYELHFSEIVVEIYALVKRAFCPGTQSTAPRKSPWLREYPDSFNKYVELLAHPDAHTGKWNRLLRDETERCFLLQAIIMKVLDTKVLSSLLFGADPEHKETLQSADATYLAAEGICPMGRTT